MPFLLPALSALASDGVVVFLGRQFHGLSKREAENGESYSWIYTSRYLIYLAIIRVILLIFPMLFHSYTGTALRFSTAYSLLYWTTMLLVLAQMIGLAFINPESIESLLPLDKPSNSQNDNGIMELFYDFRRLWWMLILTMVSNICHLILLVHVRSTAPLQQYSYSMLNGNALSSGRRAPSLYFQLRQFSNQQHQQNGNSFMITSPSQQHAHSTDDVFLHTMTDFMEDIQTRLRIAKTEWSARLEDFTNRISVSSSSQPLQLTSPNGPATGVNLQHHQRTTSSNIVQHSLTTVVTPFRVLLQLFAYQDVLDNERLDHVFDMDDGASLTFWVPQLLSFLLHGALETSPKLEEWILNKCRRNVQFAHRCYWFLRAWCLEAPAQASTRQQQPPMQPRPASSLRSRTSSESPLSPFLDEPAMPDATAMSTCNHRRASRSNMPQQLLEATATERFLPEERALIQRLMMRVKECGEVSAKILAFGPPLQNTKDGDGLWNSEHHANDDDSTSSDTSFVSCQSNLVTEPTELVAENQQNEWFQSPSKLMYAVEKGLVPINPRSGFPSVRHLDVISSHHKYGFMPLNEGESRLSLNDDKHDGKLILNTTEQFDRTPRFLDTLLVLADRMFEVPVSERRDELRKQLQIIECDLLPDNAIYMPIGNSNHRVWRIVPEESISLGTKERVPCIITMEVVAYKPRRRKPAGWSLLPKRTHQTLQSASTEATKSPSPGRRPLAETLEMDSTESELLAEWRYGRRDPSRRTTFFDKVTGTVKGATDKMSAQMREKINLFRERSASDELKSLRVAEAVLDGVDTIASASLQRMNRSDEQGDIETARSLDSYMPENQGTTASPIITRNNSSASLASMGQWSSPHAKLQTEKSSNIRRQETGVLDDSESSMLPYGSDHEGEPTASPRSQSQLSIRMTAHADSLQTNLPAARPPVVFRESWQAKESRIRQKSAFGAKPGWRLLPILIKANDDLRQEQLASQLIYRMAAILAREKVNVWLCPYEIIALTNNGGIVEAIPDTISLDSLKRNDINFSTLKRFFISHFGIEGSEEFAGAQANFVESLAAYSIVCYLLQIKDRHNGNILLDNRGHVIHIDFGFFFLSSPGSNVGFESAPFKLTRDFVDLLGGPHSRLFRTYRELCYKSFITLRRNCMEIILMVEMLKQGNEELNCFRGRPDEAIRQLRERFRLDLNDRACRELVNCLIDDSIENWRTDWYDRYQRYFVGVL